MNEDSREERCSTSTIFSGPSTPLITIGITAFNAMATIERALASALSQDWPNFEVLVVDDCSTDGTSEFLARKSAQEPRMRVIRNSTNTGCAASRNTLTMCANGDFIAFFDDDDFSFPERIRLQHSHIIDYEQRHNVSLVACYGTVTRRYPNGYELIMPAVGSLGQVPIGRVMADYLLSNKRNLNTHYGGGTPTCALMARTSIFKRLSGFDPLLRRQEDVDFAIRLAFIGGHFTGVSARILIQFVSSGDEKSPRIEYDSTLRILEKNAEYLRIQHLYSYMVSWTAMRYFHFSGENRKAALCFIKLLLSNPLRTTGHFIIAASRRWLHERRITCSKD